MDTKLPLALSATIITAILCKTFASENPLYHDDAFISLTYARNLARGNGIVFNPGEFVWGYTSPLHVLILGAIGFFTKNLQTVSVALGAISAGLAPILFFQLIRNLTTRRIAFLVFLLILTCSYNFWFLGLETNSLILAQAALLVSSLTARPAAVGFIAALCCLLRPDSILFCLPVLLLNERLRSWKTFLSFALPGVMWIAFTTYYYHAWLPQTFYAKAGVSEIKPFLLFALPGIANAHLPC